MIIINIENPKVEMRKGIHLGLIPTVAAGSFTASSAIAPIEAKGQRYFHACRCWGDSGNSLNTVKA